MSRTKRNVPEAKLLTEKEKKLAKKNKYHHPVDIRGEEPHFSQNAKRDAKKEKHRKERIGSSKEIKEQISDE